VADNEPGAQVYAAATTRDQAKIVFGEAERRVDASPALRARVMRTVNNLSVLSTSSWFRPLSADASKMDGLNIHFAAVDELHEHSTPEIVQKLNTATGARRQPLIFEITTAGHDRHSICRQHHEFSVKTLEGSIPSDAADS
jgi:phage terminase large subunit-like protein